MIQNLARSKRDQIEIWYRICPRCLRAVPASSRERHCINDGIRLLERCQNCGERIRNPLARHCSNCGQGIAKTKGFATVNFLTNVVLNTPGRLK